jgi:uncharacterized protein YukE
MVLKIDREVNEGVAGQLEAAADDFKAEVDRLIGTAEGAAWEGLSREAFIQGLQDMKPQFQQMVDGCIHGKGQALRQGTASIFDAESSVAQGYTT